VLKLCVQPKATCSKATPYQEEKTCHCTFYQGTTSIFEIAFWWGGEGEEGEEREEGGLEPRH
jgi:hypothetical protein